MGGQEGKGACQAGVAIDGGLREAVVAPEHDIVVLQGGAVERADGLDDVGRGVATEQELGARGQVELAVWVAGA